MAYKKVLYLMIFASFALFSFVSNAEGKFLGDYTAPAVQDTNKTNWGSGFLFGGVAPMFKALQNMEFVTFAGNIGYGKALNANNAVLAGVHFGDYGVSINLGYEFYFFDEWMFVPGLDANAFVGAGMSERGSTFGEDSFPWVLALGASLGGFLKMDISSRIDAFLRAGLHSSMIPVNDWKFSAEDNVLFYFGLQAKWYLR